MKFDVSVIIVNYNTANLVKQCIDSIRRHAGRILYEIIVVDNASADARQLDVVRELQGIAFIQNSQNVGFAKANNQGIRSSKGRYVLLLNSDALLLESVIEKMVSLLDEDTSVGIAGPMVLNEDRTVQSSYGDFPNLRSEIARALLLEKRIVRNRILHDKRLVAAQPFQVDWVSGACFFIRKAMLDEIGLLDESYFLFNEEVDLCLRARKAGWKTAIIPQAQVIHLMGQSTKHEYYRLVLSRYESRLRLINSHFNFIGRIAFRVIVVSALLGRLLFSRLTSFSCREEKIERFQAYKHALLVHLGLKKSLFS